MSWKWYPLLAIRRLLRRFSRPAYAACVEVLRCVCFASNGSAPDVSVCFRMLDKDAAYVHNRRILGVSAGRTASRFAQAVLHEMHYQWVGRQGLERFFVQLYLELLGNENLARLRERRVPTAPSRPD